MAQERQATDVGREIASILTEWRPEEGYTEDIADAVMNALSRYNLKVAPTMESELRTIFVYLREKMEELSRSF